VTPLGDRLLTVPIPEEAAATARAQAALTDAFAEHVTFRGDIPRNVARSRRRRATPLVAMAAALTAGAALAAVPGTVVHRWITSIVDPGPAQPLERLPTDGRLLAVDRGAARLIAADGRTTTLGRFVDVTWSPHGLFVAGVQGDRLTAMEPDGDVRWSTSAGRPVADPRWGPDGYRVAYRSGTGLRVVAGDGSADHLVALRVAPVPPAWRPDATHALAYATARGVRVVEADAALPIGRRVRGLPRHATWVGWAGPRLLLAADRHHVAGSRGGATWSAPRGARIVTAAVAPDARTVAVLLRRRGLARIVLLGTSALRARRTLATVAAPLRGMAFSPDGRWIAASPLRRARWLMLPLARGAKPRALRGMVAPRDWCCAP
jgi:hypothetical protein